MCLSPPGSNRFETKSLIIDKRTELASHGSESRNAATKKIADWQSAFEGVLREHRSLKRRRWWGLDAGAVNTHEEKLSQVQSKLQPLSFSHLRLTKTDDFQGLGLHRTYKHKSLGTKQMLDFKMDEVQSWKVRRVITPETETQPE